MDSDLAASSATAHMTMRSTVQRMWETDDEIASSGMTP